MRGDEGPEPQLSVEEELSVTRALQDLPEPPLPPALAARLDARLAQLQAPAAAPAPARAARRRWPRLVLAAAAVLVVGYGVGAVVHNGLGGVSGEASSASADRNEGSVAGGGVQNRGAAQRAIRSAAVPLHRATLRADVRRMLDAGARHSPDHTPAQGCPPPTTAGSGTRWRVRYDGAPAVLVTHRVAGGRVRAVLYACGARAPQAQVTVPAP